MVSEVDWCARALALREVEMALLKGEMVTEARFGSDMTRFADTANLADVRKAIAEADRNCSISRGGTPTRTRYAMAATARPY
ncbi:hypothetical protein NS226_13885 [Aureimonas ureilytica]|uniref:Uncharacterized protein n=1 Tax=Aureimonas ureilytica TaxID=401562 RepID=A0A175R6R7_9HYPH|nr:hypothetical protein [Aureimonas ureilytica]KTQ95017.1 hypothetical protein NS226_13885 [Aureimonas ureilytica]